MNDVALFAKVGRNYVGKTITEVFGAKIEYLPGVA
jgi:hypothetical protein